MRRADITRADKEGKLTAGRGGLRSRAILPLALPAIVNNITVPLLGLCDTAISGHLGDPLYIGAIAVGAMMMNVIYWLCGFLRAGTSGLTAQAWGADDRALGRDVLRKSLGIAACISLGAILLQTPLLRLFLMVLHPEPEVADAASFYFRCCIWASPAQLGIMACSGWFIGRQNTVVPMFVSVGVNVVNILLSLLLVFGCGLGFRGIAYGTSLSAWLGLLSMLLLVRGVIRREGRGSTRVAQIDGGESRSRLPWSRFFHVGSDLFFRSACIMGVSMAMTGVGARLGNVTLAANALMMQFFLFFSYFMDGFAFAGEALVGKAEGAGDSRELHGAVAALLRWGALMAAAFLLLYLCLGNAIAGLLTDEVSVRRAVTSLYVWLVVLPPVSVAAFIFDGVFIGLARTRPLLVTTLAAAALFFGVSFLVPGPGNLPSNGLLWTAFEGYLLLRGVLLALVWRKYQMKSLTL